MAFSADVQPIAPPAPVEPRERKRRDSLKIDKEAVVKRVLEFYHNDMVDGVDDREARLQRYAKFRMWTEGKNWPWEDSSDIGLPDMAEKSLRVQDTLHNAVMTQRPVVSATGVHKGDKKRETSIDALIDTQIFREQNGENIIAEASDSFVNDPACVIFTPWVREKREVAALKVFDPIPEGVETSEYIRTILAEQFPSHFAARAANGPWDWRLIGQDEEFKAKFYTRENGDVEMSTKRISPVFDGPRPIVMDYDNVFAPARAANLHIPGPSNPGGATHVILRDYPTVDEVVRLAKSNNYDLVTKDELERLPNAARSGTDEEAQTQIDDFAGKQDRPAQDTDRSHKTLTRLRCFDLFDIDNDGTAEDVVWWVILETKTLLKGRLLGDLYPGTPPQRPLESSSFLPVKGRWSGISLLELTEGLHDAMKVSLDQMVDTGTLSNVPFGAYRPHGSQKAETMRLEPGLLIPLSDPQRDLHIPNLSNNAQGFHINLLTILGQMEERLTVVGDLQLGRVPGGSSSALRTIGGMAMLQGQGEARPERILRRFFMLLTGVWTQCHNLNKYFLPDGKQFQLTDPKPGEEAYLEIDKRADIDLPMRFTFSANVLNTSKQALQEALQQLMGILINPIALQLGITDADKVYRLLRDFTKAMGQNPDEYMNKPSPDADKARLTVDQVLNEILSGGDPTGVTVPLEIGGWVEHVQILVGRINTGDDIKIALMEQGTPSFEVLQKYLTHASERAIDQQRQLELQQAAQQFAAGQTQGQPGAPPTVGPQGDPNTNPQVSGGDELIDESLPGAGGGANQ